MLPQVKVCYVIILYFIFCIFSSPFISAVGGCTPCTDLVKYFECMRDIADNLDD